MRDQPGPVGEVGGEDASQRTEGERVQTPPRVVAGGAPELAGRMLVQLLGEPSVT